MLRIYRPCLLAAALAVGSAAPQASAQPVQNYFGLTGTLDGAVWNVNEAGPTWNQPFITNSDGGVMNFTNALTGQLTGAPITVAGINVSINIVGTGAGSWAPAGTISNHLNGVIPINVTTGATVDFLTQDFSASTTAGYIKNGGGVAALAGSTYGGGFTLNAGTVIANGVNAMGAGPTNTLTINGGTIASKLTTDFSGHFGGGIMVGGDFRLGTTGGLANATADLTFADAIGLGNSGRTITLGNNGTQTLGGLISNTVVGGDAVTFAATPGATGRIEVTGLLNTFVGNVVVTGGDVRFAADGGLGAATNAVVIDGGRFGNTNNGALAVSATHALFVGNTAGTAINVVGSVGTLTYDGVIADRAGRTGALAKQGDGTLLLGGVSTYTGDTTVADGTLRLTTGNNRLPTGTTVNIGQAGGAALGALDLNGSSQTIAGLNSTAGTNATAGDNRVTSASAAVLTINSSGTHSFGDGTAANSGVISGAVALVKTGSGTQTLGDANTFTGGTAVNAGTLTLTGSLTSGVTVNAGTFNGTGTAAAATVASGGAVQGGVGSASGTLTLSGLAMQAAGSKLSVVASATTASLVDVNGTLSGNSFAIVVGSDGTLVNGSSYTRKLIDYTGLSGGLSQGTFTDSTPGGFSVAGTGFDIGTWSLVFGADSANLTFLVTPVPEPASVLGVTAAGVGLAGWVRRRRANRASA